MAVRQGGFAIEIGADALNAQLPCMDVEELAKAFGSRICFVAGADRQHCLPFGTPEEVDAHCFRLADAFGRNNGGYIGGGEIGGDVPLANAEAMLRTFAHYSHPRPYVRLVEARAAGRGWNPFSSVGLFACDSNRGRRFRRFRFLLDTREAIGAS